MRKFKLFFACLLMAVLSIGQMWGASPATITFSELGLTNGQQYTDPFEIDDNVTIQFAGGNDDGKYYNTGTGIRTYGNGTITITAAGGTITQAVFTWSGSNKPSDNNANVGTYSTSNNTWTGSGNESSFTLTRPSGSGNWRLQSVTVSYSTSGGGGNQESTYTIGWGTASGATGTYSNYTATSGEVNGILAFSCSKNDAGSAPAYNENNKDLRLYYNAQGNGGSITITPASGITITGAIITTTTAPNVNYSVDGGTATSVSSSNNTYAVSGISATQSLRFQNVNTSNTQLRIKTIAITYTTSGGDDPTPTCETPTFTPAAGTYASSQNVTINCATAGAAIHYTTDGTDPTTSSPTYSTAIPVSTTTTIKALAAKNGMTNSTVASATYTIVSIAHAGTSEDPYTVADAHNAILVGGDLSNKYVSGIISQIDSYNSTYNSITYWISDDGTATNQLEVYSGKGIGGANFSNINDLALKDIVVVKGTLKDFNSTHEFDKNNELVSLAKPAEPTVTLKQSETIVTELNVEATSVANQAIDIVCTNFANTISSVTAELYSESTCENKVTSDAWVTDIIVNGTKDQVTFNVADNADAARQVWLKVTASDGSNDAYAVLAISQAKFSLDYAELPFAFNGGRADIEDKDGMTQEGLDTDYTGDSNVNTRLKFNTTDDVVIIKVNAEPGTLTYDIKGNSYSGSTFKVQQSADGVDYSDVATYTELGAVQSESKTLEQTTRYVKFIYTEKVSGNVALGNITISEYVAPTVCEAPTFTPESGETFTETLDVVLASATDGATIYYTLDGSEPTTASSVFGEKITLTETTTINAIAVKESLINSSVVSATFTKVVVINSYDIDFETNDLVPYVNWNFSNIACATSTIDAHGGDYYGNTDGKTSASITTKAKYANPGTLTFWTSKESGNTTASSWVVAVSADGTDWSTEVATFSATTGNKGDWTKREADLSDYTDVYVRIAYDGTAAVRAIDDISLEPAAAVKKPVISDGDTFLTSAEVSITCGTTGATIYYTTDGSDPKSGSEYSSSFTLTETATVRAIANLGEDWSTEAESKTFTKISVVDVATALSASVNDEVYVQGTITSITEVNLNFSNATYVISDMSAGLPQNEMIVFRGKYVDGADFTSADQIHIGDVVVVSGAIAIYNEKNQLAQGNQIETISAPAVAAPTFTPDGGGFMGETDVTITCATDNSTIYYTIDGSTNPTKSSIEYTGDVHLAATTTIKAIAYVGDEPSMVVSKTFTLSAPMTVAEALAALDSENPISNAAVVGIISTAPTSNPSSGKLTYYISDDGTDTDELEVYLGFGLNGASFSNKTDLQVGDEVTVFGDLTIYNTTKEFAAGSRLLAFNRPETSVTGVEVDETATVKVNKTVQLTANVLPVNATNKNVTWSVKAGSEAYAEVSATGLVTGKAEGIAIIVVTTEDGGFTDECTVTVNPGPPANTDILTAEEIGVGSSYDDWSGNGFGTSSVYAGNSMTATGDNAGAIQLRSKDNSGIVLTASNGLYLKNLSVTVKSGSNTLNIYAKNSAYTSTEELYSNNEATRGTLIGTVSATGEMTLEEGISYNDNYQYIGMRSANGAIYLDNITITWGYGAYQRGELTANRYGTICLPNNGTIANAKLYDIDYYDGANTLYLLEVNGNAVEAGHPYIFLPSATTIEVTYTDNAGEDAGSYRGLVGSYTQKTVAIGTGDEANYILYNNAYYLVNSEVKVGENRAYIHMSDVPTTPTQNAGAPRRRVAMNVYNEQTTTDIDALNASEAPVKMIIDGNLYILRGEKLYNVNGQVVK